MSIKTIPSKQDGTALLVAMVMIFMLSIMGISAMKGSSLERRMAGNSVQSAAAFQAAESLTDVALNNKDNMEEAWEDQTKPYRLPTIDLKNTFVANQAVEIEYVGNTIAIGYSQGVSTGSGFTALNYEVTGGTVMNETRTVSAVIQGAYRIAPGQ